MLVARARCPYRARDTDSIVFTACGFPSSSLSVAFHGWPSLPVKRHFEVPFPISMIVHDQRGLVPGTGSEETPQCV